MERAQPQQYNKKLEAADIVGLQPGDKVWLLNGYATMCPSKIGTVKRLTDTLVILSVNHSEHGGPTDNEQKYTRIPTGRRSHAGYAYPSRMMGDRIHSIATPEQVQAEELKLKKIAKDRADRATVAADREAEIKRLNTLLPKGCYVQTGHRDSVFSVTVDGLKDSADVELLAAVLRKHIGKAGA